VGLVPKQLGATSVECAANCAAAKSPLGGAAARSLPAPGGSGGLSRLMSGGSSWGELSRSSMSSGGCVSLRMAPGALNPKSLKVGGDVVLSHYLSLCCHTISPFFKLLQTALVMHQQETARAQSHCPMWDGPCCA